MFGNHVLLVLLEVLLLRAVLSPRVHRDVTTAAGVVRGYLAPQGYFAYLGVPYARDTRHDRFKAPIPPRPWDGIFEATHRVKCPQSDGTGTEDCLVVNVFTPEQAENLPVLVLVHGGGFQSGWGPTRPPTRLLTGDFVIVTFNYRVSAFGFLCLGIPEAPGNAGLKDQVAALYWIYRNIVNFGGDPSDVTVYGVGAGAASIQLLLLSGSTKDLIHRVIIESGSALSPLSLSYDSLSTAIDIARSLGYEDTETPEHVANFYSNLPSKVLTNITNLFLPCLENNLPVTHSLLEKDPLEMFTKDYQMLPMLIAYTDNAGEHPIKTELEKLPELPYSFINMLPNNLKFDNDDDKQRVADVIRNFYVEKELTQEKLLKSYVDYVNDITYEYPIVRSSVLFASTNPMPVFLIKIATKETEINIDGITKTPADILGYFYSDGPFSEMDEIKVEQLITLWRNFIKIGDPTPITTYLIPVIWQPIEPGTSYSELDIRRARGLYFGKTLIANYQLADERMVFWNHIYQNFYRTNIGFQNDIPLY